jgi:hypothetical protein
VLSTSAAAIQFRLKHQLALQNVRRDRLELAPPRPQDKLSAALTGERHARWLADFRRVEEEHDALGQEFADVYRR